MPWFMWLGLIVYIPVCIFLILVILFQSGKGGGLSSLAGGGSGLQESVGSTAGERTLHTATYISAGLFVSMALFLSLGGKWMSSEEQLFETSSAPIAQTVGGGLSQGVTPGEGMTAAPATGDVAPGLVETAPAGEISTPPAGDPAAMTLQEPSGEGSIIDPALVDQAAPAQAVPPASE